LSLSVLGWLTLIRCRLNSIILYVLLITICIGLAIVIFVEHKSFFAIAYDIVSIVYLTFFILLLGGYGISERLLKRVKILYQCIGFGVIALIVFCLMNYFYPGFYRGPYNGVSSYVLHYFFPIVSEFCSPLSLDNGLALAIFAYFILGSGYLFYLYLDKKFSLDRAILLYLAIVLTLFTGFMYRWNEFAIPINILLVSFLIEDYCMKKRAFLIKATFVLALAILPSSLIFLVKDFVSLNEQHCEEQLQLILREKFLEQQQFQRDKTLFIHSNYGPLILYGSHFSVIGTNDHHNPQGLMDSLNFFKETEQEAHHMV